ncbi:UbiA family prenyltransferase [bacterium]|nr:UbiA family prenyltransferase [bacterium]
MVKPDWFDAFFILRPTLFFPSWTFFLAGYTRGSGDAALFLMAWIAAALGASFLLNQLSDRREDQINRKLLSHWSDLLSYRFLAIELIVLITFVIAGGVVAGAELSFLLALFFIVAGFLYNFPPFRLKARPILGIVSCSVGIWIGYLMGARAAGLPYSTAAMSGLAYAIAGGAVSLLTHIPDLKGDQLTGASTFPVVFGKNKTGLWALILVAASVLFSLMVREYALCAAALVALPFFYRFWSSTTVAAAELAIKVAVFSLAVFIGFTWPPFLAMIAVYYLFARWYHRARLCIEYPSFKSATDA